MKRLLSHMIGWVWMVGGSLVPLSGVHWVEQSGCYVAFPPGDARQNRSLENWRQPIAVLGLPAGAPSYNFLPPPAQEWLQRLGVVAQDGSRLSVVAVLHAPARYPWSVTERLWYRNDIRPGIAAVKLIPLSKGQVDWLEPWDFKPTPNALSVRSLPNDFVKRKFPCPHPERGNDFRIKFSGVEEHEPVAYASLVMDDAGKVHVAIEIIPPAGAAFQTLGDVEDLFKCFLNPAHPVWHQRSTQPWRPTAISPAAQALRCENERLDFGRSGEAVQHLRQRFTRTLALCTTPEEATALQHGDIPSDPEVREVVHLAAVGAAQEAVAVLEQTEQQIQALAANTPPTTPEQPQVVALQQQVVSLQVHVQHFCRIAQETLPEPTPENPAPAEVLDALRPYSDGVDISLSEAKRFLSGMMMDTFQTMASEIVALTDAVVDFLSAHIDEIVSALDVINGIMSIIDTSRGFKIFAMASARYARWKQDSIRAAQQAGGDRVASPSQYGEFFTRNEHKEFYTRLIGIRPDGAEADFPSGNQSPGVRDSRGGDRADQCRDMDHGHGGHSDRDRTSGSDHHEPAPREHDQPTHEHHEPSNEYHERTETNTAGDGPGGIVEHEVREVHATDHSYHEVVTRDTWTSHGFERSGHELKMSDHAPDRTTRDHGGHHGGGGGGGSRGGGGGDCNIA